jgi:hypothetical protein
VGVRREQRNEFIAARNGKPLWSTKIFFRTFRAFERHDVVSSGIFVGESPEKYPSEWTKQALITVEEDTEAYKEEVTAEFHC